MNICQNIGENKEDNLNQDIFQNQLNTSIYLIV